MIMVRIAKMIRYVSQAFSALAEGFELAIAKWPSDNPFSNAKKDESEQAATEQ